jgi:uncharacterized membrane protein YczE
MYESLLFALILIFLNLILTFKPMPLLGLLTGLFTILIGVTYFISDTTLPINTPTPYFTIFIILFGVVNLYSQSVDIRR